MVLTKNMRDMMRMCAGNMVNQYGISGAVEKMANVLCEIGNEIPKNYFKTSLEILNTKVEVKKAFNETVNVNVELADIIGNTFNAIMDVEDYELPRIAKILDRYLGDLA